MNTTKTITIYKVTEEITELLGAFTYNEYEEFFDNAEHFMLDMVSVYHHLVVLRGWHSIRLWDKRLSKSILTYSVEF